MFAMQDEIISKLRALVTNHNVHLTLIIHPKKIPESEDLDISSIFGSAKAS